MTENALIRDNAADIGNAIKSYIEVAWNFGPKDGITINTDGSVNQNSKIATGGGLFHDSLSHCMLAFSNNFGKCSITRAEIKAALSELELAYNALYRQVCLQLDSIAACLILTKDGDLSHQFACEVIRFRELLNRDWVVTLKHIFHEGNKAADYLAAIGHRRDPRLHLISNSDPSLRAFFLYDSFGCSETRSVLINK
ncbi:Putative ribonuclease H protein At1g65750 [Linum perenne]